jgi:hypothetical protein
MRRVPQRAKEACRRAHEMPSVTALAVERERIEM